MTVAIHADRSLIPPGQPHVPLLIPFWGDTDHDPAFPVTGRYSRYEATGQQVFRLTSAEEADVIVFPVDWHVAETDPALKQQAHALASAAQAAGKRFVVFYWSDSCTKVDLPGATVYRTSVLASQRSESEQAMPAWSEDLVDRYCENVLPLSQWQPKPIVGFRGVAHWTWKDRLKMTLLRLRELSGGPAPCASDPGRFGRWIRHRSLAALRRDRAVLCNFDVQSRFFGGALTTGPADAAILARRHFVANLRASDYAVCVRGTGNFSYRLYEVMSMGRVPVFIDTDCLLPLADRIDWRKLAVWVEEADIPALGRRLRAFHQHLSTDELQATQRRIRRVWEEHLSPQGFFASLAAEWEKGVPN